MSEGMRHCWADWKEWAEKTYGGFNQAYLAASVREFGHDATYDLDSFGPNATCFLEDGHRGAHEWTNDRELRLCFRPWWRRALTRAWCFIRQLLPEAT